MKIEFCDTRKLRHIEGYSKRRVEWLCNKIITEGIWTRPLALDMNHDLVLDGQHRMEVALKLGLKHVPVVRFRYEEVSLRSLRKNHEFDWEIVTRRALCGEIYPYKTVKHDFESPLPECSYSLEKLRV